MKVDSDFGTEEGRRAYNELLCRALDEARKARGEVGNSWLPTRSILEDQVFGPIIRRQ